MAKRQLFQRILKWIVFSFGAIAVFLIVSMAYRTWTFGKISEAPGVQFEMSGYPKPIESLLLKLEKHRIISDDTKFERWLGDRVYEIADANAANYNLMVSEEEPVKVNRWLRNRIKIYIQHDGSPKEWIETVGPMPNLVQVVFGHGCKEVTDAELLQLTKSARNLQSLSIYNSSISNDGFREIAGKLPDLESLVLHQSEVTDLSGDVIRLFPKLKHLAASSMGENFAQSLPHLAHLEDLSIWQFSCPPADFFRLAGTSKLLHSLQLSGVNLNDTDLQQLVQFAPRVEGLAIFNVDISESGVASLDTLVDLYQLNLSGSITTKGNEAMIELNKKTSVSYSLDIKE